MIDGTGYAELLARSPHLFHLVWGSDEAKLESILGNGLARAGSVYTGFWESRPGHVYLGGLGFVNELFSSGKQARGLASALLRIDTSRLERPKINPDEDHFLTQNFGGANYIAGKHACSFFHREFPPSKWAWEWAEYLEIGPLPSLGQWADAVDLGSDARETRYSIAKGSLAYAGTVPADAITVHRASMLGPAERA